MDQPRRKRLIFDLIFARMNRRKSTRKESLTLLRAIGRDKAIVRRLKEAESVNNWVLIAGSDQNEVSYKISRDEWIKVTKEAIEKLGRKRLSNKKPRIFSSTIFENIKFRVRNDSLEAIYSGLEKIYKVNKKIFGDENLKLYEEYRLNQKPEVD